MPRTYALAIVAVLGFAPMPAAGQTSPGGAVGGLVTDQQRAVLRGARIELSREDGQDRCEVTTDDGGYYLCVELAPGPYALRATRDGFKTSIRVGLHVRAGLTVEVPLVLEVGPVSQTIDVAGDALVLEARRGQRSTNVSAEALGTLPLSPARQWSDFLSIAPGFVLRSVSSLSAVHAVRGSDVGSQVVQVDGAEVASAAVGSLATVNIIPGAIEDIEVRTGPVDAASPLGVGAVVSIATRSGTNRLRGTVAVDVQQKDWNADNTPGGTAEAAAGLVPEVTAGGPLLRDHIWLFGAYRYERVRQSISRTAAQLRTLEALDPTFAPFDRRVESHLALFKMTARASSRHRVEVTGQRMPRRTFNAAPTDAALFSATELGGTRSAGARVLSVWNGALTTRAGVSSNDNDQQNLVGMDAPARRIFAAVTQTSGRLTGSSLVATLDNGGTGLSGLQDFRRDGFFAEVTWLRSGPIGRHELRSGVLWQRHHEASTAVFANDGFAREESVLRVAGDPSQGFRPFWREVWDVATQPTGRGHSDDRAIYVQDLWSPVSRLTLTLGVRADHIRRYDALTADTIQRGVAVGPRAGVNYTPDASGRHNVRASWGRLHDVLSTNRAAAGASSAGKTDIYDLDLDGVFETRFTTPASSGASRARVFDVDRGQPFIDEITAGYGAQLPGRVSADISFARREYRNRPAAVEINGVYEQGVFKGYRDVTQNEIYLLTANRWNSLVYTGLDLQVTHRSAALMAMAAYTRAFRHIAGSWQPNDPAAILQPVAFPNSRGVGGVRVAAPLDANSLSGTHMTADNMPWADHAVQASVAWHAPARLVVASVYTFQSGAWSGPIVTRLPAPDLSHGPSTLRLSNGRMVSNPLATTLRFAYPARTDGQLQAPSLHLWNMRAGYRAPLDRRRALAVSADVFNIINADHGTAFVTPGANQEFSPDLGRLTAIQPPRALRLRFSFEF